MITIIVSEKLNPKSTEGEKTIVLNMVNIQVISDIGKVKAAIVN